MKRNISSSTSSCLAPSYLGIPHQRRLIALADSSHSDGRGNPGHSEWVNLMGVHANVWVGGWTIEECQYAISKTAELGYDLIELTVSQPEMIDVVETKAVLRNYGLAASGSLCLALSTDISSPDASVAAAGEQVLLDALQVVAGVGGKYMTGITYGALAKYPAPFTGGAGRQNMIKILRNVATRAADAGVVLGLEVVNRYENYILNTAQQAMEMLEELQHENVMVHLDTYHMNIEERSFTEAVQSCGDMLGYVHIGESHRGYLGSGTVNFPELFAALASIGYSGPITFESFSSKIVNPVLSNNLCVWRNLWDDSEDLGQQAKEFMDSEWGAAMLRQVPAWVPASSP